jgi:hypothetical protein
VAALGRKHRLSICSFVRRAAWLIGRYSTVGQATATVALMTGFGLQAATIPVGLVTIMALVADGWRIAMGAFALNLFPL